MVWGPRRIKICWLKCMITYLFTELQNVGRQSCPCTTAFEWHFDCFLQQGKLIDIRFDGNRRICGAKIQTCESLHTYLVALLIYLLPRKLYSWLIHEECRPFVAAQIFLFLDAIHKASSYYRYSRLLISPDHNIPLPNSHTFSTYKLAVP